MLMGARALSLVALVLGARPDLPPTPPSVGAGGLYQQARAKLRPALEAYGRTLLESLESSNPYERRMALERLGANHDVMDEGWVPALVRRLVETTPLYDESCAGMVARLDKSYGGQGEELYYAECKTKGGTSNGALAARLLAAFKWTPEVVAFVMRGPGTVEAVLTSLGPGAGGPGPEAVQALAKVNDPAVEAALLRMALVGTCTHQSPEALAPIAQRFASAAPAVRGMAPLAYLRLSDCASRDDKRYAEPRARAIAAIEARLADGKDQEILDRLALVAGAGHSLVPALVARQKAMPQQLGKVLAVLGAIGSPAHPAVPTLLALLRDPKQEPRRGLVLETLARIGPTAAGFKQAALDVLAENDYLLEEVAAALASGFVRLSPAEFALLERPYRKQCARAGAVFMFNLDRDRKCDNIAGSLEHLADVAHRCFRASNWLDAEESDE